MKTSFKNSFVHCIDKLDIMKKLLLLLLLVPMVSFGQYGINYYVDGVLTYSDPQASLEALRASSEECKTIFVNSVNSFYDEAEFLCLEHHNKSLDIENVDDEMSVTSFSEVANVPRFLQCYLVDEIDARVCFQEEMNAHIRRNFRYPEIAQEMGVQGRVYVNFIISECGYIENIRLRGPDENLEKEAYRIISLLPRMLPATMEDGTPTRIPFSVPLSWRLEEEVTENASSTIIKNE